MLERNKAKELHIRRKKPKVERNKAGEKQGRSETLLDRHKA